MFKAEIEWRGLMKYKFVARENKNSSFKFLDKDGAKTYHMPAVANVASFRPMTEKAKVELGTRVEKKLLGRDVEKPIIEKTDVKTDKTLLFVLAPISVAYGSCPDSELRQFAVNVPYEAIKHLSVIAERTGAIVDLTKDGQSAIREAFETKSGLFEGYTTNAAVLDPKLSLAQNLADHTQEQGKLEAKIGSSKPEIPRIN